MTTPIHRLSPSPPSPPPAPLPPLLGPGTSFFVRASTTVSFLGLLTGLGGGGQAAMAAYHAPQPRKQYQDKGIFDPKLPGLPIRL